MKQTILILFLIFLISPCFAGDKIYTDEDLDAYRPQSVPKTKEDIKLWKEREADLNRYLQNRDREEQIKKEQDEAKEEAKKIEEENIRANDRYESKRESERWHDEINRERFERDLINSINSLAPPKIRYSGSSSKKKK
jgi:hypothetical protein